MALHWNILDDTRTKLLPLLAFCTKAGFYLAGGTGLALQIGHRDSIDFDFFLVGDFDTAALIKKIEDAFSEHAISITQQEKNTVSCLIDERVQLSFFGHPYPVVKPLVKTEHFDIASIEDIGCMKLTAITGRSVEKDYVDLYFISQKIPLKELLSVSTQKYPTLDTSLILKSLVYFDDVLREPILFKEGHEVSFEVVKGALRKVVADYFAR